MPGKGECSCQTIKCSSEARKSSGQTRRIACARPVEGVLLWNADNHVARCKRMLVPDNRVLTSNKEVFLPHKRDCFCQAKACLAHTKQSFVHAQVSSRHTTGDACACQYNACPKQGHLLDSFRQSHSLTRGAGMWEGLCYVKECLLHTKMPSCKMQPFMCPHKGTCLCRPMDCSPQTRKSSCHGGESARVKQKGMLGTDKAIIPPDKCILMPHNRHCLLRGKGMLVRSNGIYWIAWANHLPVPRDQTRGNVCVA